MGALRTFPAAARRRGRLERLLVLAAHADPPGPGPAGRQLEAGRLRGLVEGRGDRGQSHPTQRHTDRDPDPRAFRLGAASPASWDATRSMISTFMGTDWRAAGRAWTDAGGQASVKEAGLTAGAATLG